MRCRHVGVRGAHGAFSRVGRSTKYAGPAPSYVAAVGLGVFEAAREICELPAEAVAIARKLLRPPPEDMTRRIDQEAHLFAERMRSNDAVAAFKAFVKRKSG